MENLKNKALVFDYKYPVEKNELGFEIISKDIFSNKRFVEYIVTDENHITIKENGMYINCEIKYKENTAFLVKDDLGRYLSIVLKYEENDNE